MSKLVPAAGMAAVARQFRGPGGVVAILATVLAVARHHTIARWMSTLVTLCHKFQSPYLSKFFVWTSR